MKKGESRLEIQQKTESPQIEEKGVKLEKAKRDEVKILHEVEQNKAFFKRKSKESAMNKGSLKKKLSAETNRRACVILLQPKKMNNRMCSLEREVVRQYVDTYSG